MSERDVPTVIVKAVDAGACYLYWRWLHALDEPQFAVIDRGAIAELTDRFDSALPQTTAAERAATADDPAQGIELAMKRAMTGLLTDRAAERSFFEAASALVLPPALISELLAYKDNDRPPVMRIHPPPSLARLPWELLVIDADGARLLESADIRLEPPVTARADRHSSGNASTWADRRNGPVIYVLDPDTGAPWVLPPWSVPPWSSGMSPPPVLDDRIREMGRLGRLPLGARSVVKVLHARLSRVQLSRILRSDPAPSRLIYVGHVSSADDATIRPESAALHLSDGSDIYGSVGLITESSGRRHRPFTALDLLAGTLEVAGAESVETRSELVESTVPGRAVWPMPPRVALLACDSGSDHRFTESFGLVIALIINGAEIVTATRWVLPTDHAFHEVAEVPAQVTPTADMIVAVDRAHEADNLFASLQAWQRSRLNDWRRTGAIQDSPLIWAAVATHHAPALPRPSTNS